jgi:hypothetical protein
VAHKAKAQIYPSRFEEYFILFGIACVVQICLHHLKALVASEEKNYPAAYKSETDAAEYVHLGNFLCAG